MKTAKAKTKGSAVEVSAGMADSDQERKWRAEDGLRTLADAEKIKRDPKLMADIEKARKAKMADLASIKVEVAPRTIGKK